MKFTSAQRTLFAQALHLHQQGKPAEALAGYRRLCAAGAKEPDLAHLTAAALYQLGQAADALEPALEAVRLAPKQWTFLNTLGEVLRALGRNPEAIDYLNRATQIAPKYADAWNNLGLCFIAQGNLADAETALTRAVALEPENLNARNNLGSLLLDAGRPSEAAACFEQCVKQRAGHLPFMLNLAAAEIATGRYESAAQRCHQAESLAVAHVESREMIAILRGRLASACGRRQEALRWWSSPFTTPALRATAARESVREWLAAGEWEMAEKIALVATQAFPNDAVAWSLLGEVRLSRSRLESAKGAVEKALALAPQLAGARCNLGLITARQGDVKKAEAIFREVLAVRPTERSALTNLGQTLLSQGRLSEARASFQRCADFTPTHIEAWLGLADCSYQSGDADTAQKILRELAHTRPQHRIIASNYLLSLLYNRRFSPSEITQEHQRVAAQAFSLCEHRPKARPQSGARLRVGYVTADARKHSVSFFWEPLLAEHDRSRFDVFVYASVLRPDSTTARLRGYHVQWRDIVGLTDAEAAELVKDDGIDILVDLGGHTGANRLGIFTYRPALRLITALGYPSKTGLTCFDYRVTDAWADPSAEDDEPPESYWRLQRCAWCYRPDEEAREIDPNQASRNGAFIFGSFNALSKLSDETCDLWSAVLRALPDAELCLKSRYFIDFEVIATLQGRFTQRGIAAQRVRCLPATPRAVDHLMLYREIDVALDTFPYHGTTTTCEALWMGVPVVTLMGDRHAARVGGSLLVQVGQQKSICHTPAEFVARAVELHDELRASDSNRRQMRELVENSVLCDQVGYARAWEEAFIAMFERQQLRM